MAGGGAAAGPPQGPGGGAEGREDLYAVLGVSRSATLEQVREAYFERALLSHPDLAEPGQEEHAAETFSRLAQAFWVLTDPARRRHYDRHGWADLGGFSLDVVHDAFVRDGLLGGPAAVSGLVEAELQMRTPEERFQRFTEAFIQPTGPITGERWRCELCGFQVRGRERVAAHLAKAHGAGAEAWAREGLGAAEASLLSFLKAAGGLGPGDFTLADGSRARLPAAGPPPGVLPSIGQDLERALRCDDPCGPDALAAVLDAAPPEVQDVVMQLNEFDTGLGAYLAPLPGLDPNLAAPHEPELLNVKPPR